MSGEKKYLNEKVFQDCKSAREKFEAFELAYRVLRPSDLRYLRELSAAYKKAVLGLQELILPAIRKNCPHCPYGTCCSLHKPELSIYSAESIGCFNLSDYLLVRCDTELPAPDFTNEQRNLCAYWDKGCRLQPDCRSLICLQFFCEPLQRNLEMKPVEKRIAELQGIVNGFSFRHLFQKKIRIKKKSG